PPTPPSPPAPGPCCNWRREPPPRTNREPYSTHRVGSACRSAPVVQSHRPNLYSGSPVGLGRFHLRAQRAPLTPRSPFRWSPQQPPYTAAAMADLFGSTHPPATAAQQGSFALVALEQGIDNAEGGLTYLVPPEL